MKRRTVPVWISAIFALVSSCSRATSVHRPTFDQQLDPGTRVELKGWLTTRGEFRLFVSKNAMRRKARYPECVSGVMEGHRAASFQKLQGKHVTVIGTVWDYESLPEEQAPVVARKKLGNSIITNWCFGPKVLLVDRIDELR